MPEQIRETQNTPPDQLRALKNALTDKGRFYCANQNLQPNQTRDALIYQDDQSNQVHELFNTYPRRLVLLKPTKVTDIYNEYDIYQDEKGGPYKHENGEVVSLQQGEGIKLGPVSNYEHELVGYQKDPFLGEQPPEIRGGFPEIESKRVTIYTGSKRQRDKLTTDLNKQESDRELRKSQYLSEPTVRKFDNRGLDTYTYTVLDDTATLRALFAQPFMNIKFSPENHWHKGEVTVYRGDSGDYYLNSKDMREKKNRIKIATGDEITINVEKSITL